MNLSLQWLPAGSDGRVCLQCRWSEIDPWVGRIPSRRKWQPTPVFFPGESHGQRSLVGYSPWSWKESDTTEWLHLAVSQCNIGYNPEEMLCVNRTMKGTGLFHPLCNLQHRTRAPKGAKRSWSVWKERTETHSHSHLHTENQHHASLYLFTKFSTDSSTPPQQGTVEVLWGSFSRLRWAINSALSYRQILGGRGWGESAYMSQERQATI